MVLATPSWHMDTFPMDGLSFVAHDDGLGCVWVLCCMAARSPPRTSCGWRMAMGPLLHGRALPAAHKL